MPSNNFTKLRTRCAAALIALLPWPAAAAGQTATASIGIEQLDDMTQSGAADSLVNMIESALGATGRFRVVERARLVQLRSPPPSVRGRRGRRVSSTPSNPSVDYLIQGTITAMGVRARTNIGTSLLGGVLSGLRGESGDTHCTNQEATIGIDIRVLNAGSREIRNVLRVTESQRAAAVCGDQSEIDVPRLLRAAANRVAADLVTSIYPIQIAAVQPDGSVILNYGTGTVQPNAAYAVYLRGQPIRDPATGQTIGNEETRLGYIRILEVTARTSRASPIGALAPQIGAVVRSATPQEMREHERGERQRRRQRGSNPREGRRIS